MTAKMVESGWAPWAGLVVGPLAWGFHHQIGSNMVYMRCALADAWVSAALGGVLLLITVAATWISWMSQRAGQATEHALEMRRFVAWLGTAGGGLFALAVAFQITAGFLVRTCAP